MRHPHSDDEPCIPLCRPNHFFHDSLGDPAACTGDHNHPEPEEIPPAVLELARQAKCPVCGVTVVDDSSVVGAMMVNYYSPASGAKVRAVLCGRHGLALREFLHPEILESAEYQAVKETLLRKWA